MLADKYNMNKPSECSRKRSASPRLQESLLSKQARVDGESDLDAVRVKHKNGASESSTASERSEKTVQNANGTGNASGSEEKAGDAFEGQKVQRSDRYTAIIAAEALASLTGGMDRGTETPCSSRQALSEKPASKPSRGELERSARAEDSCSVSVLRSVGGETRGRARCSDEEEDDSLPGSSLTASSSDDDDEEEDDQEREECAIISVQMAPELRRSVALLAHVQTRLDALEKKGARLHRRLELRLVRQRRPHLEQRAAIAQSIPGFWLTAVSFLQIAYNLSHYL